VDTVPHPSPSELPESATSGSVPAPVAPLSRQDTIRSFARAYMSRGWHCMLLAVDGSGGKIPPHNCPECDWNTPGFIRHLPDKCGHLLCHGFYAATTDADRFDRMLTALPSGELAIRTGQVSRLLVIDAESTAKPGEPSGLEVLDSWSWAAQTTWNLPETRKARSVSGGLHLYYRLPPGVEIKSGRILPGVDVKSEYGYVGAVSGGTRTWLADQVPVAELPKEVVTWLMSQKRLAVAGSGGQTGVVPEGYDFSKFAASGCPGGYRDFFFNDLAFRLRMGGHDRESYDREIFAAWTIAAQPPAADYDMPWEHVAYKADRVWATLQPSPEVISAVQRRWIGYAVNPLPIEIEMTQLAQAVDQVTGQEVGQTTGQPDGEGPGQPPAETGQVLGQPPPFERDLTETGNAHRFIGMFTGKMLYVSGLGWHIWNEQIWQPDQTDEALDRTQQVLIRLRQEQEALAARRRELEHGSRYLRVPESTGAWSRSQII
jgi:hypothetical protein